MPRSQPGRAMQSSPAAHAELSSQRIHVPQLRVTSLPGLLLPLPPLEVPAGVVVELKPAELLPAYGLVALRPAVALDAGPEPPGSAPPSCDSSGPDSYLPEQPAPTETASQIANEDRAQAMHSRYQTCEGCTAW